MNLSVIEETEEGINYCSWWSNFIYDQIEKHGVPDGSRSNLLFLREECQRELHKWGARFSWWDDGVNNSLVFDTNEHSTVFLLRWS